MFSYCHGLAFSPYGIVTRDRRSKRALATVRRLFRDRQGLPPPPSPRSERNAAGDVLHMIRRDLADIPDVPFPEGYGIRPMQPDEGGLWMDIWRDAEPYLSIEDDLFERVFGSNLAAIGWRCYLVTGPRGVAVGTIAAWIREDDQGEPWGQVHWVAIRPAYRRLGLARAALAYTLRQLARWHDRAYLGTQSRRLGAIRLYLDLGFEPDLGHPGASEAWSRVGEELEHPTLRRVLGT